MSKSNLITKINEWFAQQKFATDYTAVTGEIIRCLNELSVGEKVVQVLQGVEASLPDGNYTLDNGKAIAVLGGEIKEINDTTASETMETIGDVLDTSGVPVGQYAEDYKNKISAKLMDGTEVEVLSKGDALSIGDMVLLKDDAGEFTVKAPEGKHILEGGLTIYVDAEGLINELETEETDATTETDELKKQMGEMFASVSKMTSIIDELKTSLSSIKDENKSLTEKVNKFSVEPSAVSITEKHFSKVSSKEDKLKFLAKR
jgi:hypothetical protein